MSEQPHDYTTEAIDRVIAKAESRADAAQTRAELRNVVRQIFSNDLGYEKVAGTD